MIRCGICNQRLTVSAPKIVSGTRKYLSVKCTFNKDWEGYEKVATFEHQESGRVLRFSIDDDNEIKSGQGIDLSGGVWELSLHGIKKGHRITTNIVTISVEDLCEKEGEFEWEKMRHALNKKTN